MESSTMDSKVYKITKKVVAVVVAALVALSTLAGLLVSFAAADGLCRFF